MLSAPGPTAVTSQTGGLGSFDLSGATRSQLDADDHLQNESSNNPFGDLCSRN